MSQIRRKSGIAQKSPCAIPRHKYLKRGKGIKRKGPKATLWDYFAKQLAEKERDEDGLLTCEGCGDQYPILDLHHNIGRDTRPDLYFDRKNLRWLCRGPGTKDCHGKAHNEEKTSNHSYKPRPKTAHDPAGQMAAPSSNGKVLAIQTADGVTIAGKPGRTVYSSVQDRHARLMVRKKEGSI